MKNEVFVILQAFLWSAVSCVNFNITNLSNCVDIPLDYQNDAEVEVRGVTYETNALGFADVVHGKFVVHIHREHKDSELILAFFKCAPGSQGLCDQKMGETIENLDCKRFHSDKTGPWYMYAPAMDKKNPCAEIQGEFDLIGAQIKGEYLEKYMKVEEGHYRIRFLYHLPHETMDLKYLRGCIELDFDIYA